MHARFIVTSIRIIEAWSRSRDNYHPSIFSPLHLCRGGSIVVSSSSGWWRDLYGLRAPIHTLESCYIYGEDSFPTPRRTLVELCRRQTELRSLIIVCTA